MLKWRGAMADNDRMNFAQLAIVTVGGWCVASVGAAIVWARIGSTRRAGEPAGAAPGNAVGTEAIIAGALDGSPWAGLGPLQDRIASRRARRESVAASDASEGTDRPRVS